MKTIGLTGGAGSGKSYVAKLITEEYGYPVIDSDSLAKTLMQPGGAVDAQIRAHFGADILNENGQTDRNKLAKIVFQDRTELLWLNSITHPAVIAEIKRLKKTYENRTAYLFVESAIADQAGYAEFCDELWYVYADEQTRKMRLSDTRGYSEEKIQSIKKQQSDEETFFACCDKVINNSAGTEKKELMQQLDAFLIAV